MHNPNRPKALQKALQEHKEIWAYTQRIAFLRIEQWEWPAIVFNEWDRGNPEKGNISFEQWVDIFPILIDVVVDYEEYQKWYEIRGILRKFLWKFNGILANEWEGTIAFKQFLAPDYNSKTNKIVFWSIYLLKQNYDYHTN